LLSDATRPEPVRVALADTATAPLPAAGDPAAPQEPPTLAAVARWVEELRDDDVPGNAGAAMARLCQDPDAATPVLRRALASPDRQQRHLAAALLRRLDAEPSADLCAVSVEALAREVSDELCRTLAMPGATDATRYLARHAAAAHAALRFGLGASDPQQRFLCAYLLAAGGDSLDLDRVSRELIEHLADNEIDGDALMASHGLYRLGARVRPILQSWLPHVDDQARSLLDLIDLDLRSPPRDQVELAARRLMQNVTTVYHDPALHFDVSRSRVPTW